MHMKNMAQKIKFYEDEFEDDEDSSWDDSDDF